MIIYSTLNCFQASVAAVEQPELRSGKIAVSGRSAQRSGIILSANYSARRGGVREGMSIWDAKRVCPELFIVQPDFNLYLRYTGIIRGIYKQYSDSIEPYGMEGCWIDLPFSKKDSADTADEIRRKVREQTGLTVSIGISFSRAAAKLAGSIGEPDAVTVIGKEDYKRLCWDLPVSELLYVGYEVASQLKKIGVTTVGQLAGTPDNILYDLFGTNGYLLKAVANGNDTDGALSENRNSEIQEGKFSADCACDLKDNYSVWLSLYELAQGLSHGLIQSGLKAQSVSLCVKDGGYKSHIFNRKLGSPSLSALEIAQAAFHAFYTAYDWKQSVRGMTLAAEDYLAKDCPEQLDFFGKYRTAEKKNKIDTAVDCLRNRFGRNSVLACCLLNR